MTGWREGFYRPKPLTRESLRLALEQLGRWRSMDGAPLFADSQHPPGKQRIRFVKELLEAHARKGRP